MFEAAQPRQPCLVYIHKRRREAPDHAICINHLLYMAKSEVGFVNAMQNCWHGNVIIVSIIPRLANQWLRHQKRRSRERELLRRQWADAVAS
jgi:hypothetical protein